MTGYEYQTILGAVVAMAIGLFAVRSFRARRLSFSLLFAWITVAALLGLAPPLSWLLRTPAEQVGVSPSGVVLALATGMLLLTLFRISLDVSSLRRLATGGATQGAIMTVWPPPQRHSPVLVLVPAYNEAGAISGVVRDVLASGFDCLVVDDGSTDLTGATARSAGAMVATHPVNLGVGAALRTGFRFSHQLGYESVVQCDGDGQHDASDVARLVDHLTTGGLDLVIGSRWRQGGQYDSTVSTLRRAAMSTMARYASRVARHGVTDPTSGFRAFSGRLAHASASELGDHYLSDTFELLVRAARAGYRIDEVSTSMRGRTSGVPSAVGMRLALYAVRAFIVVLLRLSPPLTVHSSDADPRH